MMDVSMGLSTFEYRHIHNVSTVVKFLLSSHDSPCFLQPPLVGTVKLCLSWKFVFFDENCCVLEPQNLCSIHTIRLVVVEEEEEEEKRFGIVIAGTACAGIINNTENLFLFLFLFLLPFTCY